MAGTAHVAETTDGWESRWLGQHTWLRQLMAGIVHVAETTDS